MVRASTIKRENAVLILAKQDYTFDKFDVQGGNLIPFDQLTCSRPCFCYCYSIYKIINVRKVLTAAPNLENFKEVAGLTVGI